MINLSDILKKQNSSKPYMTIGWENSDQKILFKSPYIKYKPNFTIFNKSFFYDHMLPDTKLRYRNNKNLTVLGSTLGAIAKTAVDEVLAGKKELSNFTYLKKSEFHKKTKTGTFILKFKDYPFVLKLFIESPHGIASPYTKGVVPFCIFLINGVSRHILGFTRIKNLEYVKNKIRKNSHWRKTIDTPQKWFWIPQNTLWLKIKAHNLEQPYKNITIPSVYGIVVEHIESETNLSILKSHHRKICFSLYNFLSGKIDPHMVNFIIEKQTRKIVIIDTEHLPTIVGMDSHKRANGYISWYAKLIFKIFKDQIRFYKKKFLKR